MALHRALMRGNGFFDWMTADNTTVEERMAGLNLDKEPAPRFRPLPVVNYLDIADKELLEAIVNQALPDDRARFRQYLSNRPLGFGTMTAVSYICLSF